MGISCFVTVLTLLAGLASVAPSFAQGLAEVAKQEESRRQNVKQETKDAGRDTPKVFTNKDLRGGPAGSTAEPSKPSGAPAAQSSAPKAAASAAASEPAPDGKAADTKAADGKAADGKAADAKAAAKGEVKDEAYWRKRAQSLRDQLERDRTLADALQSRISALTADFTARDDPAQRAKIGLDREKALVELERMKKAVSAGTKAIADLDEEARRAGVPPGWLR
jgi:hypothetical protein